jgi:hypothetical protein
MVNISRRLKAAVEQRTDIGTPEFDTIIARAATRRRRYGAAAVVAAVVAIGTFTWIFVAGFGANSTDNIADAPRYDQFEVPASTWTSDEPARAAMRRGTMSFTDRNCPYLASPDLPNSWLVFPAGARGIVLDDGRRAVVDKNGYLYATEGQAVKFSGGGYTAATLDCAEDAGAGVYSVQQEPAGNKINLSGDG